MDSLSEELSEHSPDFLNYDNWVENYCEKISEKIGYNKPFQIVDTEKGPSSIVKPVKYSTNGKTIVNNVYMKINKSKIGSYSDFIDTAVKSMVKGVQFDELIGRSFENTDTFNSLLLFLDGQHSSFFNDERSTQEAYEELEEKEFNQQSYISVSEDYAVGFFELEVMDEKVSRRVRYPLVIKKDLYEKSSKKFWKNKVEDEAAKVLESNHQENKQVRNLKKGRTYITELYNESISVEQINSSLEDCKTRLESVKNTLESEDFKKLA